MIDPIIFTFELFGLSFALRWYGVLAMVGLLVGAYLTEAEIKRRKGDPEVLWDGLIWFAIGGVVGARLWYVLNAIAGGNSFYIDQPGQILNIPAGGLHIYGAILGGGIVAYFYLKARDFDFLLFLDAIAAGLLVGQAIGRISNYINQELYGPPTDLPWGVPISAEHRIAPWNDLGQFPESTRFHPTFFYEAIWNVIGAGFLLYIARVYKNIKPGVIFFMWMVWAGLGRFLVEAFRPDQPRVPGTDLSFSRLIAGLLALSGVVLILAKYKKISIPFIPAGPDAYRIQRDKRQRKKK
jgi:phosphatidylglycerol:prolipoprotein diacylglycerol transferase